MADSIKILKCVFDGGSLNGEVHAIPGRNWPATCYHATGEGTEKYMVKHHNDGSVKYQFVAIDPHAPRVPLGDVLHWAPETRRPEQVRKIDVQPKPVLKKRRKSS